jgi:hypothetical protein
MKAWGSATALGSKTIHAPGATPGGMQVDKAIVAWGGKCPSGTQWSDRWAALYRRICSMLNKNIRDVKETGCTDTISTARQFHKFGYEDAKLWMERRLAAMKSGVPNWAATAIAGEWQSSLSPDLTDLDKGIAEIKAANLARHYTRWHVPHLGSIEQWRPDGTFRFLGGQLNSASSTKVWMCKVEDLLRLIND